MLGSITGLQRNQRPMVMSRSLHRLFPKSKCEPHSHSSKCPCKASWLLERLHKRTGLSCNAHTFKRTFASLLRKAGVDSLTIRDLGRWESATRKEDEAF